MLSFLNKLQDMLDATRSVDWLAPLALRLYLAPVFWVAGTNKLQGFENVVAWFGNSDWGLGLPFPTLMATLAVSAEVVGAVALILGLATRWSCIPLIVTMVVAATGVHWNNGWQAVHDLQSPFASPHAADAIVRLDKAKEILQEHGNYEWLTQYGNVVLSNNGIEWSITYLVMLLALLFMGGGRYVSLDYWIERRFRH